MAATAFVTDTTREGYPSVRLSTSDERLAATFCPRLGMIGCSLEHDGEELLGQRGGLARYEAAGSTMGIPLLHPWANRLSGFSYEVEGKKVVLDRESPLLHIDSPTGLPIHGALAASPLWRDVATSADAERATLSARLDYGAHAELMAVFPFPHELRMRVELSREGLTIRTELSPRAGVAVPVSFGFHPYLRLPGVARADWMVELPVRRRIVLDEHMIPTGDTEPVEIEPAPLGDRTFDDGFCELAEPPVFALTGGGRRIEVEWLEGYRFAQVYAPDDQDVVCFEPMTSATNALRSGSSWLSVASPDSTFGAAFRIRVTRP